MNYAIKHFSLENNKMIRNPQPDTCSPVKMMLLHGYINTSLFIWSVNFVPNDNVPTGSLGIQYMKQKHVVFKRPSKTRVMQCCRNRENGFYFHDFTNLTDRVLQCLNCIMIRQIKLSEYTDVNYFYSEITTD